MLICKKKINFIPHLFFRILQRNSKLVILGDLGMPDHKHLKWQYQSEEIVDVYLEAKKQLHCCFFPGDVAKILPTCYFGYFGHTWLQKPKMIVSSCRKLYQQSKEPLHSSCFSGDIAKICKLLILDTSDMSGYAHPRW